MKNNRARNVCSVDPYRMAMKRREAKTRRGTERTNMRKTMRTKINIRKTKRKNKYEGKN